MLVRSKILSHPKLQIVYRWLKKPWVAIPLILIGVIFIVAIGVFTFYYARYQKIVEERIRRPIFNDSAKIYAAPDVVRTGDRWSVAEISEVLRRAGYTEAGEQGVSQLGTYRRVGASSIEVRPGPDSFHSDVSATIRADGRLVRSIRASNGSNIDAYELEPLLITGLFDAKNRAKRRLLTFNEIPKRVVDGIVSTEDKRFFEHGGINYVRLVGGMLAPVVSHRRMQGGSTLTMQMARLFFLTNERSIKRKMAEMMIALQLEHHFSKQQILEIYVNRVPMGQLGSFAIEGLGEASQAYFGKSIGNLNLPEAALLVGLMNGASYFSPYRHADRAVQRRNIVLQAMFDNHTITRDELRQAKATPLKLASADVEANTASYYIDLVRERLLSQYKEAELNSSGLHVYTTLDQHLQEAASDAIESGMKLVDNIVIRQRTRRVRTGKGKNAKVETKVTEGPMPQVALIALDPHTGEVLALQGGRNYSKSQYNRATAKRPTGSIFKPFVYAAAMNTAFGGNPAQIYTQTTLLDATEGVFEANGEKYTPHNFDPRDSIGQVTARDALAHSVNTATIRLAEMTGYDKVVQLATAAGIQNLKPTPSVAIGAYDSTPLEMAGAYTIFANNGEAISPQLIRSVRDSDGDVSDDFKADRKNVLDPRVAFLLTDMMQQVINGGTATGGVRSRFNGPAAGKTGSSHDAWFAGYTSNLLCVVWVGNDDYTDIKIEGGKAAAPIWADFMVRARKLQRYRDMKPFTPPPGVAQAHLDKATNLLATSNCPDDYDAYFIEGTTPVGTCDHPDGDTRNVFQRMLGIGKDPATPSQPAPPYTPNPGTNPVAGQVPAPPPPPVPTEQKQEGKKGFWGKLFGRGKKEKDKKPNADQAQPQQ